MASFLQPAPLTVHRNLLAQNSPSKSLKPPKNHVSSVFFYNRDALLQKILDFGERHRTHKYNKIPPPVNWGINFVWPNYAYIVEKEGKYLKTLKSGIHFLNPITDKIAHVHYLGKQVILIPVETIPMDDTDVLVEGEVYMKIVDPFLASYGNGNEDKNSILTFLETKIHWSVMFEKIIFSPIYDELKCLYEEENFEPMFHLRLYEPLLDLFVSQGDDDLDKLTRETWGVKCLRFRTGFSYMKEEKPLFTWGELIFMLWNARSCETDKKRLFGLIKRLGLRMWNDVEKLRDYCRKNGRGGGHYDHLDPNHYKPKLIGENMLLM